MAQPTPEKQSSFFRSLFQKQQCNPWLFTAILILCFGFSAHIRFQQYETWKKSPGNYFVGERPMMTTLDAPYFLRIAREYREGTYGQKQGLAIYPDQTSWLRKNGKKIDSEQTKGTPSPEVQPPTETSFRSIPMLSFIVAQLVPFFDGNYYKAGTLLVPIFASLFILPLGVYFFLAGYPAAGLLGGVIATFCAEYFMRSSIGRIDTDMLNLFFPAMSSLCVFLAYRSKNDFWALGWSAISGASLYLFLWWYAKPGFLLAYLGVLLVVLFLRKTSPKMLAISAVLFILFAGPSSFQASFGSVQGFLKAYWSFGQATSFQDQKISENTTATEVTPVSFPNVMNTISEAQKAPIAEIPTHVLRDKFLGWTGLLAFLLFIALRWKETIPLIPMILLGLLAFRSARRFIMYLAPFVGIGFGMLITLSLQLTWEQIQSLFSAKVQSKQPKYGRKRKKEIEKERKEAEEALLRDPPGWFSKQAPLLKEVAIYAGAALFFVSVSAKTAISFVPGPSIPTRLYSKFLDFKKILPENAALLTWWDYGYALTDATGLATFHDGGGSQFSKKTYFIARGLVGDNQLDLHNITRFIATEGNAGVEKANTSYENLIQTVQNPRSPFHDPVYLLFTMDMIGKFSAISAIGTWDFETQTKVVRGFQRLKCTSIMNNVITCQNLKIDIRKGLINGKIPLRRLVQVLKGNVAGEKKYGRKGHTLQIIMASAQQFSDIFLVEEKVFQSNFNQLYLLGRYDKRLYKEVYNSFPATRMFQVNDVRANDYR